MKRLILFISTFFIIASCDEENAFPNGFLDYEHPSNQYLRGSVLASLDDKISNSEFGDIHSLIIIRNDNIIYEKYYSNYSRSDLHQLGAGTQSIVSVLTGIALMVDSTISLEAKIVDLLPGYNQYFDNIPQKDQIEIQHLLSNSSGLWWDEWTYPFGSEQNDAYKMTLSDAWISVVLSTPMIREPGFEFNYNSGNGILMAPILQQITGIELEEFAKEKLFDPLNIQNWNWERIPDGHVNASWGLSLRSMDMAKIGYLLMKNGYWNEEQIFDESWLSRSTRSRRNVSQSFRYSYFWWRFSHYTEISPALRENDIFFSWGDGGQFMFVIPHLDMVIVTTAGNYPNGDIKALEMLREIILAVVDRYI